MPSADDQIDSADETAIAPSLTAADQRTVVAAVAAAVADDRTAIATLDSDDRTAMAAMPSPPVSTSPPASPAVSAQASAPVSAPAAAPEDGVLAPNSIFHGDFRISESVAKRGGMGEVYRATNTINNTIVAIKMIRADLSHDPELVNKFIQEDEALRQLNNPAVVRYYGVRRDPVSGRYYIQMEFVDGPTLGEYVRERGAVPAPEAKALCRHLALGLEDAHRSGIVHRDLSPDNVLLGNSELKNAKIIDFGIAKVASTGDFTTFRTSFVGKYRYASPEHFSASAPIDQRSDIYSLGLVIAAAAAGKPLEMGRDELSGATARLTVPDLTPVPAALRPMLTRMLDPDPLRRPTAAELVVQLAERKEHSDGGNGAQILLWLGLVAAVMAGGAGGAYYLKQHPEMLASITGKSGGSTSGPTVFGPGTTTLGNTGSGNTNFGNLTAGGTTSGNTGTGSTGNTGTGNTGTGTTVFQPTGNTGTGTTGTQVAKLPTAPFDSVRQAVATTSGVCTTLAIGNLGPGRVQVAGLMNTDADIGHLKTTVESFSWALDDQTVASGPACQTLQLLGELGRVNALTGGNRPTVSASHSPPVFHIGDSTEVTASVSLSSERQVYWIRIDGSAGTAVVEHESSRSFVSKKIGEKVTAPGWDLVLALVAPHELPALDALNQTTLPQLNIALEAEIAKPTNHRDVMSGYQFIRRTS